jgi:hypothetical protein
MKAQSILLVSLLFMNLLRAQEPTLHITVVAGEGVTHNVTQLEKEKKGRFDPIVQVDDANGKPVQGASVAFTLPSQGPGGTFANSNPTILVTTDPHGRAVARGILVNKLTGPFSIHVTASYQGRTANATISQTTISATVRATGPFGVSDRTWVIAGVVLLAIGGGVFAAKSLKSGSNGNVLTATPGVPVVGGPQ